VRVLHDAGCDPVVVVLGAWVGEVPDADVVVNELWPTGMGSSLRCGLEHLGADAAVVDRVLVTLVDLPGLTLEAVRRLADVGRNDPREVLASATYEGVRGHPVLFGRSHWGGVIASATGDRGARAFLADHQVQLVEVGDVATGDDLDTPVPEPHP
jgi:CTP:molybdopterin cytidylyltransferase MocA